MRILFLLTGKKMDVESLPVGRQMKGFDLAGNEHIFDNLEFVNNLQTIGAIADHLPAGSVYVRHILHRNHPRKLWKQGQQLQQFIREENIAVVHQFWGGPAALFMARSCGKTPFVLSLLGSDLLGTYTAEGQSHWKGKLLRKFSIWAAQQSARVVVMSAKMKAALPVGLHPKTLVLPEGINRSRFYAMPMSTARQYLKWPEHEIVILFFNNGNRVKNPELAYAVVQQLQSQLPNVRLHEVKFVPHQELVYYYNAANVLLLTSLHEGSNNSLKEALACQCPVVSSPTGDAAEQLEQVYPSAVVNAFEPATYVQAIVEVLNQNKRANNVTGVAVRSIESVAVRLLLLYHELGK